MRQWWKKLKKTQISGKIFCAHRLEELILVKMSILLNTIYRFNEIPIKRHLSQKWKKISPKFIWNHKRLWIIKTIFNFFFFYLSTVDTQCYISFRGNIVISQVYALCYVHQKCSYHLSPYNALQINDYVPYIVPFIPVTYSFHNWKSVSHTPLHPFCLSLHLAPLWQSSICSLYLWVWFQFLFVSLFIGFS